MKEEKIFAACIRAWRGQDEVARIDVAVSRREDYYPVRDAVMAIAGVDRVEISTLRQRKVYVLDKEANTLFGGWKEQDG